MTLLIFPMGGRSCILPSTYTIGTRGSLLALTQCQQVADELKELTGHSFELKIIKTQGDLITDKPLWQLEGKDFFTKELDSALLNGEIDLVVHSYKDLGSVRPEGIQLAAITERFFGHDILLARKDAFTSSEIIIGTSSPRRQVNIQKSLKEILPHGEEKTLEIRSLRGNINTRIEKLKRGDFDGIILALAGLERLARTPKSKKVLEELFQGLDFMVLPQGLFPAAASQGALGIECLKNREDLLQMLKKIHHEETAKSVQRERQAFNQYGGGCHLAVGIHVKKIKDYYLHVHKGEIEEKEINETHLEGAFPSFVGKKSKNVFVGLTSAALEKYSGPLHLVPDILVQKDPISNQINEQENFSHLLVTSKHAFSAFEEYTQKHGANFFVLAAGNKTMKLMAQKGHWVNAGLDGLGDEELKGILNSKCLEIFSKTKNDFKVLSFTHDKGSCHFGKIYPSYKRTPLSKDELKDDYIQTLKETEIFYWTSYLQFQDYVKAFPEIKNKFHCCGLGKTLDQFKKENITIRPFFNMLNFYKWAEELYERK